MKNKIVCFHTLNNFSGSPLVLATVIKGLIANDYNVELYTSKSDGLLSNIPGLKYSTIHFNWSRNKIVLLLWVVYSQLRLFLDLIMKFRKAKNVIFYINTITPWGAALAGKFLGVRVVYHCHEVYVNPNIVNIFCKFIKDKCAYSVIGVSEFVCNAETNIKDKNVVYNSLDNEFLRVASEYLKDKTSISESRNNVLMISSLKEYKGIYQLIKVAELMPDFNFVFLAGAPTIEVDLFKNSNSIPFNMLVYSAQSNVHRFYQDCDILLNLSIPNLWQETFGMTLLEAMVYGKPVIAPPVGGPIEIVGDGVNGFIVDSRNINDVIDKIHKISDLDNYSQMSKNSLLFAKRFSSDIQVKQIMNILEKR